jgi:hypothetical protein
MNLDEQVQYDLMNLIENGMKKIQELQEKEDDISQEVFTPEDYDNLNNLNQELQNQNINLIEKQRQLENLCQECSTAYEKTLEDNQTLQDELAQLQKLYEDKVENAEFQKKFRQKGYGVLDPDESQDVKFIKTKIFRQIPQL